MWVGIWKGITHSGEVGWNIKRNVKKRLEALKQLSSKEEIRRESVTSIQSWIIQYNQYNQLEESVGHFK